uniref:Protein dalmatian n=1 Tax=Anopheles minimus TaxID=112268 RepID=A0A182W1C8_9DIPT
MPSTVGNGFTVDSDDNPSSVNRISRRTRGRTLVASSENAAPGLTSRKSAKTRTIGREEANCSIIPADVQRKLVGCKVLLVDIFKPKHIKDVANVIQIHNVAKNNTAEKHAEQNKLISVQPNSNVTRRTSSRRTKSIRSHDTLVETRSSTLNIISEGPHSILHVDESSTIGPKGVVETVGLSQTQTIANDDVIVQATEDAAVSKPRRGTRRLTLRASDSITNTVDSRKAPKRKSDNDIPPRDMGVSPPKQTSKTQTAAQEESAEEVSSTASQEDIQPGTDGQNIESGTSIIHLDQSSVGTKSIAEIVDSSKTSSGNDVIVQMPTTRRVTRRISNKAADFNDNTTTSRKASIRKSSNVVRVGQKTDMCPQPSVSSNASNNSATIARQSIITGTSSTNRSLDKLNNNAFKTLIVSIKRVASASGEAELKRLKYEDSTRNTRGPQRPSTRIRWNIKVERETLAMARPTMAKPNIVITSPIIEVPESSPVSERKQLGHSYLNVSKTSTTQMDTFRKPHPPTMPQLIEHEDEGKDDVYEFLSSSQTNGVAERNKAKQKPKHKKGQKATGSTVKNKPKATGVKPKAKPRKQANPFGCSKNSLQKIIKNLGGGPVKQPDTVNYKINMEVPAVAQLLESTELPYDDPVASDENTRISHPTVERLTTRPPSFPITSTPAHRLGIVGNLKEIPQQKPASPWRIQDDVILPNTSYTHRTKEMIPCYESFEIENNNLPIATSAFVTARRKSPHEGPTVPVDAPESSTPLPPGERIVSDKDLHEIEQMYKQLKATSEMSHKLIRAMRTSKQNPTITPQQNQTMRLACLKLKKWYDRSMNAFNRSMRIISNIQRTTERSMANSPVTCASPLTVEQQRTVDNFNLSTDRFRSMLDQLHSAINDSDVENRPPPSSALEGTDAGSKALPHGVTTSKPPKDVVILPERGATGKRNPLMALNVVPLLQRESPLMSPLAKDSTTGKKNLRRELQYDKENDFVKIIPENKPQANNDDVVGQIVAPDLPEPSVCSVVEINDQTTHDGDDAHSTEAIPNTQNCFGFDDDNSMGERSAAQITLPMPLNISHETLQRKLQDMKQLLPKRPFFRTQPNQQHRSSVPTRFPTTKVRVFGSPTKRPHTLREFVASTPRPAGGTSTEQQQLTVPSKSTNPFHAEAPDVSAIERNTGGESEQGAQNEEVSVALFDTPEQPQWLNNSAHQRTYTRIPRRKKKNIYLANLGLDDDSDDEGNASDGGPQELSSDSDTGEKKRKNKANKARRKQPARVEQTKEFKQFVDSFNSMCEEVERYELIIE